MTLRSLLTLSWPKNDSQSQQRDQPFGQEVDRLLDSAGHFFDEGLSEGRRLRLDVSETDKGLHVTAELKGLEEKDIQVTLLGDMLTIGGTHKSSSERNDRNRHLVERSSFGFTEKVKVPFAADPKAISTRFDNGVLHVTIPKRAR